MSKVDFLIEASNNIDIVGLQNLKIRYFDLLHKNEFPKNPVKVDFYSMINFLKRRDEKNPISIGPYYNISPFEAVNRIASDLVIINGLLQLARNGEFRTARFTLRLGTTHVKDKGDFTISLNGQELEGEAFNVAPSFLKAKLSKTLTKWRKIGGLQYILINADAFEGVVIKSLDTRIIKVENWHT
jgi:hypothetical protein